MLEDSRDLTISYKGGGGKKKKKGLVEEKEGAGQTEFCTVTKKKQRKGGVLHLFTV